MTWLVTIAVGFIGGTLGKFLLPGKDPKGCLITIILGVIGSIVGRFLGGLIGFEAGETAFDLRSIAFSTVGVIVILLLFRVLFGKKKKKDRK